MATTSSPLPSGLLSSTSSSDAPGPPTFVGDPIRARVEDMPDEDAASFRSAASDDLGATPDLKFKPKTPKTCTPKERAPRPLRRLQTHGMPLGSLPLEPQVLHSKAPQNGEETSSIGSIPEEDQSGCSTAVGSAHDSCLSSGSSIHPSTAVSSGAATPSTRLGSNAVAEDALTVPDPDSANKQITDAEQPPVANAVDAEEASKRRRRKDGVVVGDIVEEGPSSDRGRILKSRTDVEAGETLLVEKPLLFVTKTQSQEYDDLARESGVDATVLAFWAQARREGLVQEVLDLLIGFPLDSEWATELHKRIEKNAMRLHEALGGDSIEEFVQFAGAIKRNRGWCVDVAVDGENSNHIGQGVWRMACLLSHSCSPNCFWFSGADGVREVRTLVPVRKDEELSVSYLEGVKLTLPTMTRREELLRSHGFVCSCTRCCRPYDDVRQFSCMVWAQCGGTVYGYVDGDRGLCPCDMCGAEAPEQAQHRILEAEMKLGVVLSKAEAFQKSGQKLPKSLREEILEATPLHDRHYLAPRLAKIRYTILANPQGPCYNPLEAAAWVVWELRCLERLHPRPASSAVPFDMESAADLLLQLKMQVGHNVDLRQAMSLYQSALKYLATAYGITHPYTRCCERKFRAGLAVLQEFQKIETEKAQAQESGQKAQPT